MAVLHPFLYLIVRYDSNRLFLFFVFCFVCKLFSLRIKPQQGRALPAPMQRELVGGARRSLSLTDKSAQASFSLKMHSTSRGELVAQLKSYRCRWYWQGFFPFFFCSCDWRLMWSGWVPTVRSATNVCCPIRFVSTPTYDDKSLTIETHSRTYTHTHTNAIIILSCVVCCVSSFLLQLFNLLSTKHDPTSSNFESFTHNYYNLNNKI